jgi:Tfp pilus assembly protein PilF
MRIGSVVFALGVTLAAYGAGGSDSGSWSGTDKSGNPTVQAARAALAAGDFAGAQLLLKVALADTPDSADLHNLYAYSMRKGTNPDMALVFKHYGEALRIDPKHLGANEYIGEAYLLVNEPAKAKQHLAALDKLCFFGCAEYSDLKKAIAAYESKPRQ